MSASPSFFTHLVGHSRMWMMMLTAGLLFGANGWIGFGVKINCAGRFRVKRAADTGNEINKSYTVLRAVARASLERFCRLNESLDARRCFCRHQRRPDIPKDTSCGGARGFPEGDYLFLPTNRCCPASSATKITKYAKPAEFVSATGLSTLISQLLPFSAAERVI